MSKEKFTTPPIVFLLEEKIETLEAENKELREAVKCLRELAIDLWQTDASETDWEDVDRFHEIVDKAETLAKIEKGEV